MYDGDVDWQGEATTYATKTIKDWVDKGYISKDCTGTKAEDAGQAFMNGTYPMFFSGHLVVRPLPKRHDRRQLDLRHLP